MAESTEERLARVEARLQWLEDKQAIHDGQMRYCRGLDRHDREMLLSAFHPGALADHGMTIFTAENIADSLDTLERSFSGGMHVVGNELIEIDGDVAVAEFYFISYGERQRDGKTFLISRAARYVDRWERRAGEWKIAYRVVVGEWDKVEPVLERMPTHDGSRPALPAPDDDVYKIRDAPVGSLSRTPDADAAAALAAAFLKSGFD